MAKAAILTVKSFSSFASGFSSHLGSVCFSHVQRDANYIADIGFAKQGMTTISCECVALL